MGNLELEIWQFYKLKAIPKIAFFEQISLIYLISSQYSKGTIVDSRFVNNHLVKKSRLKCQIAQLQFLLQKQKTCSPEKQINHFFVKFHFSTQLD
jgi:hypothetical protein